MTRHEPDFYSIQEFADKLSLSYRTIFNCIKKGRISAFRVSHTKKGAWRIPATEIHRLASQEMENLIEKEINRRMGK